VSLWHCPEHGLTGPMGCCAKASLARIEHPLPPPSVEVKNETRAILGLAPLPAPSKPDDPKCETASWVLENGIAVCENCRKPIDEIFGYTSDAFSEPTLDSKELPE
jgi:hypothetical protein